MNKNIPTQFDIFAYDINTHFHVSFYLSETNIQIYNMRNINK